MPVESEKATYPTTSNMDAEDIQITLRRVHNDLQRIFESRGWLSLLNQIQEPLSLENSLGNALFHSTELKLKVNQILEQRRKCTTQP